MRLRRISVAFAALLLVAGVAMADETERFQKTVPLAPGGTLRVNNFSGHVTITGSDRAEVVIDAVRRAPRERLDRIKLDVQVSGSTVTIEANKKVSSSWFGWNGSNVVQTDMEIQVPRHVNLNLTVFSSPLTVTGVEGQHRIHTFSGTAKLVDVTGPVRADTFSGNIDLSMTASATRPDLNFHTFSGNVDLRLPASIHSSVDFDSFSGALRSDVPMTFTSKTRRSLKAEIGTGSESNRSSITVKTFSGNVHIRG